MNFLFLARNMLNLVYTCICQSHLSGNSLFVTNLICWLFLYFSCGKNFYIIIAVYMPFLMYRMFFFIYIFTDCILYIVYLLHMRYFKSVIIAELKVKSHATCYTQRHTIIGSLVFVHIFLFCREASNMAEWGLWSGDYNAQSSSYTHSPDITRLLWHPVYNKTL